MPLTPISVKGKRKTPPSNAPLATQSLLEASHKRHKRSLSAVVAARDIHPRPTLESFPVEILDRILIFSQNMNLPYASPILGRTLSANATLIRLVTAAFGETWERGFGVSLNSERAIYPATEDGRADDLVAGDPVFQTAVLAQAWAKLPIILQAQQSWAAKHAGERHYAHGFVSPNYQPGRPLGTGDHPTGGFNHFNAHACFEHEYEEMASFRPSAQCPYLRYMPPIYRDMHPDTLVPMDVVTGPWDEEQKRRLFWFCRGGRLWDRAAEIPDQVKWKLLQNAVLDVSVPIKPVLNCLPPPAFLVSMSPDMLRTAVIRLAGRLRTASYRQCDAVAVEYILAWCKMKMQTP